MSTHLIPSARARTLGSQLAALGLVRVLSLQADPQLRCRFEGASLVIETSIDDLAQWLVDEYVPSPVLSPWNEGSGFGTKDKEPKKSLDRLLATTDSRLDGFRAAYRVSAPLAAQARLEGWAKERLVSTLRNRCPDLMLPWLDAAVVLLDRDRVAFPPLLGTGGNDLRLDFSTNFHQRLLEVLPTEEKSRQRSHELAADWLRGANNQPLSKAAVGQFDPGAAGTPNSSPYGPAESLVNPWTFLLMVEGTMLFASAPARRLASDTNQQARAAMPFMTFGSAFGSPMGSNAEESRGEVWFPWWGQSLSINAIHQLFVEGRAVWRGRIAVRSEQMYLATASRGLSPTITGLDRYTIVKRNGKSFSAVLADHVNIHDDASVLVVQDVEDWPDRLVGRRLPATIQTVQRRFGAARIELVRATTSTQRIRRLRDLLSAVTDLELAVGRSGRTREDVQPWSWPRRPDRILDLIDEPAWRSEVRKPEFRLALSLASLTTEPKPGATRGRTMREILAPLDPPPPRGKTSWRQTPIVAGFRHRPLIDVLSDVLVWLTTSAPNTPAEDRRTGTSPVVGTVGPRGIPALSNDTHAWITGDLDDGLLEDWLAALLVFDWQNNLRPISLAETPEQTMIDPALAVLTPFRHGISAAGQDADTTRYGLTSEWVTQLVSGHPERAHESARRRLRMLGWDAVAATPRPADLTYGRRLAAALLPRIDRDPLRIVARRLHIEDQHASLSAREETA